MKRVAVTKEEYVRLFVEENVEIDDIACMSDLKEEVFLYAEKLFKENPNNEKYMHLYLSLRLKKLKSVEIMDILEEIAENGNIMMEDIMVEVYYNNSKLSPADKKKALYWCTRAANRGNKNAQYYLGNLYHYDEIDYDKAVQWYKLATKQGQGNALYELGRCYEEGHGVKKDCEKAFKIYAKSVANGGNNGENDICLCLALCYSYGIGVEEDLKEAFSWYSLSGLEKDGTRDLVCGNCHYYGIEKEKNLELACYCYTLAAEAGNTQAMFNLGLYYYSAGETINYGSAFGWFKAAATKGLAEAQYNLGYCYEFGEGVKKDLEQATYWYEKAKEKGITCFQDKMLIPIRI